MNKGIAYFLAAVFMVAGGIFGFYLSQGAQTDAPFDEPAGAPGGTSLTTVTGAPATFVDFELGDIDGARRQISEWQGKGRLINFWATWCAPCRREIPLLKSAQVTHAADDFQVIGIAVDEMDAVVDYAVEAEFNYPILVGQEDAMAAAENAGVPFVGLPFTMILAPDGQLLTTHVGEIHAEHIERIVDVFAELQSGSLNVEGASQALAGL